ncbi:MAG: dienelactone hydrolase [Planctomycetota bacterium]|jgi:dienelactone hydrolase
MSNLKPGVLLVHDGEGVGDWLTAIEQRFVALGFELCVPTNLSDEKSGAFLPDRQVQALLESSLASLGEREHVDADRLSVVGFGAGGTHAFLLGCASCNVAAIVNFESPLIYAELAANQPIQPLEMALNLSAPLLAFFSDSNPELLESKQRLEVVGSQFAKDFDIVGHSGPSPADYRFLGANEGSADQYSEFAQDAWRRIIAFLREQLELSELADL